MSIRFPKRSWLVTIAACAAAASAPAQAPSARTNAAPTPVCAAEQYRVQLKTQPTPDVYLALGGCLLNANRPHDALEPLEHAVQLGPGIESAHRMLADALSRLNRNQEAEAEWRAALKIEPASKAALDGLARSLIAQGEPEKVITLLADADRDENLNIDLSQAYHKIGQLDDEGHVLREALKADPDSDRLTAALVSHLVDTLYTNDAMQLSEDIARRKPDDVEAQRILLRTLVLAEERSRALVLGERLVTLRPHDADLLNLTGLLEYRAGEFDAARKHLQESVALNPNDYNSRVNLGKVLAEERDPAGAALQFRTAISLGTDTADVHFLLSRALRTLGKTAEAQQQAAIAQQKQRDQIDRAAADLKASLAAESVKAGDNQRAAELYRDACAADPGDAGLQYRLAMVLDALGDAAGEREALEASIKANPKFALAQYQLGYMDFKSGNNAEAEQHFRATVEAVPGNAQAWLSLAATLATEQRIPEAREAVANALKADPANAGAQNLSRKLNEQQ